MKTKKKTIIILIIITTLILISINTINATQITENNTNIEKINLQNPIWGGGNPRKQ